MDRPRRSASSIASAPLPRTSQFSSDPVNLAAFVGQNDLSGYAPLVSALEARKLLAESKDGQRPVLPDVRNLNEYETSHVRGALHIPVDELRFRLDEVPRDRPIIARCRSGFRSHLAVRILKEKGWTDVRNLTGGYVAMTALGGFVIP
jgi:rhodanese-related sulfurtransferase